MGWRVFTLASAIALGVNQNHSQTAIATSDIHRVGTRCDPSRDRSRA
ncbi:MAG: hypothetical protein AAFX40_05605 [Cyanobacteria bacterium J06639_1]